MIKKIKCKVLTETSDHMIVRIGDNTMKVDLSKVDQSNPENIKHVDGYTYIMPKSWSCLSVVHIARPSIPLPVKEQSIRRTNASVPAEPIDRNIDWQLAIKYLMNGHFETYYALGLQLNTSGTNMKNRAARKKTKTATMTDMDFRLKKLALTLLSAEQLFECRIFDQGVAA